MAQPPAERWRDLSGDDRLGFMLVGQPPPKEPWATTPAAELLEPATNRTEVMREPVCRWKGNGPATRRAMERFKWRGQARRFYVDRATSCQQLASVMCRCLKICWSRAGWPNSVLDYKNQGVLKARRLHCDKLQAHTCDTATTWLSLIHI